MLKLGLSPHLPREIVWRRKFGMSVPITDWVLGPTVFDNRLRGGAW